MVRITVIDELHWDAMDSKSTFNMEYDYKYNENDSYDSTTFNIKNFSDKWK